MPKEYSLKLRSDFKKLYKFGIRKASKNFSIVFMDSNELKFGYLVKKDDIKRANRRNYSKRLIREIVRTDLIKLCTKPMFIGINAKVDLKELVKSVGFDEVKKELIGLFNQINFNAPAYKKDKKRTFDDRRSFRPTPKSARN